MNLKRRIISSSCSESGLAIFLFYQFIIPLLYCRTQLQIAIIFKQIFLGSSTPYISIKLFNSKSYRLVYEKLCCHLLLFQHFLVHLLWLVSMKRFALNYYIFDAILLTRFMMLYAKACNNYLSLDSYLFIDAINSYQYDCLNSSFELLPK